MGTPILVFHAMLISHAAKELCAMCANPSNQARNPCPMSRQARAVVAIVPITILVNNGSAFS